MRLLTVMCVTLAASSALCDETENIKAMIVEVANESDFDSALALAIAKTESNFNPNAIGLLGEIGLFQLRPEYHRVSKGQTRANVKVGIEYLKVLQSRCLHKDDMSWVICFNLGEYGAKKIRYPKLFPYYLKVAQNYQTFKREIQVDSELEVINSKVSLSRYVSAYGW